MRDITCKHSLKNLENSCVYFISSSQTRPELTRVPILYAKRMKYVKLRSRITTQVFSWLGVVYSRTSNRLNKMFLWEIKVRKHQFENYWSFDTSQITLYKAIKETEFSAVQIHHDLTISAATTCEKPRYICRGKKCSHQTYHSCRNPPKKAFAVVVFLVLKTLLITNGMEKYSHRATLSIRQMLKLLLNMLY